MRSRRQFLKSTSLISLAPAVPTFLGKTALAEEQPKDEQRILVVVQLDGGNDGINTIVPFQDEGYAEHRPKLRIPEKDLIKLGDDLAVHPRLRSVGELFNEDRLSVVHGVGYPNPNRSHFESINIWHTAATDIEQRLLGNGWLGDAVSLQPFTHGPHAMHMGEGELPIALRGRRCTAASLANSDDLKLRLEDLTAATVPQREGSNLLDFVTQSVGEAYVSANELAETTVGDSSVRYPGSKFGERLKLVSQTIKSGAKARIYYTSQGNYDTHAMQLNSHANLLGTLSSSLKAFMDDLKQSGLDDRVAVLVFSEFGRRVTENGSLGTDHGTAGPVFLLGTKLKRRTFGTMPLLTNLRGGDLRFSTDFRDIYASVITDWLELQKPATLMPFGETSFFS